MSGVMKRRSEWTLKELHDRTERKLEAEITPVLKSSYRMQGPVDDSDLEFGMTNSGVFPTEEKLMFVNDSIGMKIASGTCNICSGPCSSCMHDYRSSSVIGSNSDSGYSGNICSRGKADLCFSVDVNGTTLCKSRTYDDSQNASSETSNMLGMSSSHNSYSENAESKSTLKASAAHDLEDKPQMGFSGEVVKKKQPLEEKTYQGHLSADSHISIHLGCRDLSGQGEGQHGLECHGDNISCITGGIDAHISDYGDNLYLDKKDITCGVVLTNSLILNANETSVLPEVGDGLQVHEIEEGRFILRRSNATADASILNDTSNSASVSTTPDNSCFPLLKVDVSPICRSPISHSKNVYSSFHKTDFSDTEGNLNMKLQAGCMEFAKMDNVESSLGSFSAVCSAGRKPGILRNIEVSRINEARSCLSSEKSKVDDLCQELRTDTNCQISSDNGSKSSDLNGPLQKDLETTNRQGYNLLPLANTEIENSESESVLYDVKVCDICGDVGRENLLALCSRCSDGAEHTYCMLEKLDKLPEVDWLCEECKIKELENHNVDKSDTISGGSKPTFLSRSSENAISTLIPKELPKLDAGVIVLDARRLAKGLESPKISTRRQADHVEGIKTSKASAAPIETASPRKTPVLSCMISFKNQKIKVEKANMESSEGQSVIGLQTFHHSHNSLSSGSFKCQPQAHSPYRHSSRSVSFSNSIINQKVKQLVENVPYKQKIKREAMSSKLRNGTLVKSINKSASFNRFSLGRTNTEPASKDQSFHPRRVENPRGLDEVKERIIVEKKNSSAIYKTSIRKLAAPASNCHLKMNRRSSQNEGKEKTAIESSCQSIIKRSYDTSVLGCNDSKKRVLHSSRSTEFFDEKLNSENHKQRKEVIRTGFSAVNGSCIKVDMASQNGVLQPSESDPKDNKIRDSNILISPRLSSSGANQTLHFQNCNKTVRVTQKCSTDKLEGSAYRPSDERNLSKMLKKGKECEDVVVAIVPKTRMLNKGKNLDKLDKLPEARGEVICKADSRNTPSSFSQSNIALAVDCSNDNDSLKKFSVELRKAVAPTDSVNLVVQPTESLLVPNPNCSSHIPTLIELNVKSLSEASPRESSVLANQLRASTIPKLEFIWQGSFNVLRSDSRPQLFDGIQAHLPTSASHRVLEVAKVFPSKMQLEEVSQTSSWPMLYQGMSPKEENIALFFFAKDNESYEKSYSSLLNKMLKNDLALRRTVGEAELFIFTSKMLPAYSQRWNMLYYLWGMFIGKRKHCLPTQKKNCESTLGLECLGQGVSELPLTNGSNAQNLDTAVASKIFSECDECVTSPKIKQGKSTMGVDLHCISSEVVRKACRTKTAAFAMSSLNQVVADAKITQEIPLFLVDNLSRTTAKPLDAIDNPELQLHTSQFSHNVKIGMACQDKFLSDGTNEKDGESPSHASDTNIEASLGRASPVPSVSPNSNPGEECSTNECKHKKRRGSPADLAILGYNPRGNILDIDWFGRKFMRSCSPETVLQTSGESTRWKQIDDEREQRMTYCSIGSSFGEENSSSTIFSQKQHTHNICSEPVVPEISRIVERSFFPVDIGPSTNNKNGNPAHNPSLDDDDNIESYTPDLELTLGGKSKTTKPAPLLPLLFPSVDRGSQHRRSGPSWNHRDGDDLSALLSL